MSRYYTQQSTSQYVIILDDGSHLCTCLWLINHGIACRHFFQVISYSSNTQFLILQHWYNDKKYHISRQKHYLILTYQIKKNERYFFCLNRHFSILKRLGKCLILDNCKVLSRNLGLVWVLLKKHLTMLYG